MRSWETGILLLALLVGAALVPCVNATVSPVQEAILKNVTTGDFTPAPEFRDYLSAPSLSGVWIWRAMYIARTSVSPASGHKMFGDYLAGPHGQVNTQWAYPYSGAVYLSMTVGSPESLEYGLAYTVVNLENATVLSDGFTDWHRYW